jgi:hypothetical protein
VSTVMNLQVLLKVRIYWLGGGMLAREKALCSVQLVNLEMQQNGLS